VEVEQAILTLKAEYPTWGSKKLHAELPRRFPGIRVPVRSTIGAILKRHGLVKARRVRRNVPAYGGKLTQAKAPNHVWCVDFKGQFRLKSGLYCYPLTITDQFSRYILCCEALESTSAKPARHVFERVFERYGLPNVIRSDNGTPFASRGLGGFSALSLAWIKHGVMPERIEPGCPQQNGQHERMHLTLKQETTRPAGANMLQQQERFDAFVAVFNNERPHEALEMARPAEVYVASERRPTTEPLSYPLDDDVLRVRRSGHLLVDGVPVYLGQTLGEELVGVRQLEPQRWLVSFGAYRLGEVHTDEKRFEPDVRRVCT
jgi:putative transposase